MQICLLDDLLCSQWLSVHEVQSEIYLCCYSVVDHFQLRCVVFLLMKICEGQLFLVCSSLLRAILLSRRHLFALHCFFNVQLWIINFAHVECSAICCISAFAVCHVPSSIFFIVLQRDSFFPILSYLHLPVRFHYHQGTLSVQGCAVEALL